MNPDRRSHVPPHVLIDVLSPSDLTQGQGQAGRVGRGEFTFPQVVLRKAGK